MKSKQAKFILATVIIIILVVGIGVFANKSKGPGKFDEFAKALKERGVEFYGAFWCPHCQTQKAQFGSSKVYLPYIECSNPDQSVTKVCLDAKIESYPTWKFKDGITLSSVGEPLVCEPAPGIPGENDICRKVASKYFKTWIFPDYKFSIKSDLEPVEKDSVWKFEPNSRITGEVPLQFLASQIGFTLPS